MSKTCVKQNIFNYMTHEKALKKSEVFLLNEESLKKIAILEYNLDSSPPYYWQVRNINIRENGCLILEMVWLHPETGELLQYFEMANEVECPE